MLCITSEENMASMDDIQAKQLERVNSREEFTEGDNAPVVVNLGYNVHGNEPSCGEASMLAAYY